MELNHLTSFFMWCTIINGALLFLWTAFITFTPNLVYRTQKKWFPMPEETFKTIMYGFLGLFKIFFLIFNLVPYIVLLIMK